jgi:Na+/proline symporter
MGVILGSAVVPIALCVTWKKANKWGCVGGAVVGFAIGLIAWVRTLLPPMWHSPLSDRTMV